MELSRLNESIISNQLRTQTKILKGMDIYSSAVNTYLSGVYRRNDEFIPPTFTLDDGFTQYLSSHKACAENRIAVLNKSGGIK